MLLTADADGVPGRARMNLFSHNGRVALREEVGRNGLSAVSTSHGSMIAHRIDAANLIPL